MATERARLGPTPFITEKHRKPGAGIPPARQCPHPENRRGQCSETHSNNTQREGPAMGQRGTRGTTAVALQGGRCARPTQPAPGSAWRPQPEGISRTGTRGSAQAAKSVSVSRSDGGQKRQEPRG